MSNQIQPRWIQRGGKQVGLCLLLGSLSLGCMTPVEYVDGVDKGQRQFEQAVAIRNIGVDHLNNWRLAMAIRELRRAEELNPNDALTLVALGQAYMHRGLLEDAEENLLRALELDYEFHEAYVSLSALYIQLERFAESIPYSQYLIEDPTFETPWRAFNNRGWAELQLGQLASARKSFREALDYRGYYWPARLNLGILDSMQGRQLEAIEGLSWVLEENTGYGAHAEAAYRLGEIYVSMGSRTQAVQHFSSSAELDPYGRWGKRSKDYLKLLR
jgi:tetratricopeptide (TPR) repeat protein